MTFISRRFRGSVASGASRLAALCLSDDAVTGSPTGPGTFAKYGAPGTGLLLSLPLSLYLSVTRGPSCPRGDPATLFTGNERRPGVVLSLLNRIRSPVYRDQSYALGGPDFLVLERCVLGTMRQCFLIGRPWFSR